MRQNHAPTAHPIEASDAACLWLAALLTLLCAVLTTLSIYGLVRRHYDRQTAWLMAGLWPLVPAVSVFYPKSDVLFTFPATFAAWLWLSACDRQSILRAAAAGVVLWIGMMLSLAFVTVMALMGVMTLWEAWTRRESEEGSPFLTTKLVAAGAIGFVVPVVLLSVTADVNLWNVWSWNFANHALFYEHNQRTRWLWLVVNPVELAFAVGLPLTVIALASLVRLAKSKTWQTPRASAGIAFIVVWGLLWLSGKNMGEAARLWILMMPWVLVMSAEALGGPANSSDMPDSPQRDSLWIWGLAAQFIVTILTIMQVDGFHFAELIAQ